MNPFIRKNIQFRSISISFLFLLLIPAITHSQKLDLHEFEKREDSLKKFGYSIVFAPMAEQRLRADSQFVKILVRTLKLKNSFYYPFDSLNTISKLYSPDSVFRIFTWQFKKDELFYLQQGAIQMKTRDGSLKLIPLHDVSMFTKNPLDSIRTPNNWIGAIYYRIIEKEYNGKKIYTLLGVDDYSIASNKKWMEILTFNEQGNPVFGGPYISFKDDSAASPKRPALRYGIEYKKEAASTFNYDREMDMIVYDELISESDEPANKETYVPDGDFQGFKWQNGLWVHVPKLFDFKLKDGQFPQEQTILDDAGSADEQKLKESSDKNKQKKQASTKQK